MLLDVSGTKTFEIVATDYDRAADVLQLSTRVSDNAMDFAVNPANPVWSVKEKFFRLETGGPKNGRQWTSDLDDLKGFRYIRYRITFEADAQGQGIGLDSPLPLMDYLKVPFVW